MANFEEAYYKTMGHEGGYTDDPSDVGGETYKGIARTYNPDWDGWTVKKKKKGSSYFPSCLDMTLLVNQLEKKCLILVLIWESVELLNSFKGL